MPHAASEETFYSLRKVAAARAGGARRPSGAEEGVDVVRHGNAVRLLVVEARMGAPTRRRGQVTEAYNPAPLSCTPAVPPRS